MGARKTLPLGINKKSNIPYNAIIVDDNKTDRVHLKQILLRKEFNVLSELESGLPLKDMLPYMHPEPDILLIDYDMPKMNGLEVLREIRPKHPNLKIVMVTSHSDKNLIQELVRLKVNGIVLKPFTDKLILEKLAPIFGRMDLLPKEISVITNKIDINLSEIQIPSIPTVALKVMAFDADNPQGGSSELEQIISPDKAITSNIIRIANSSFYGRSGKVQTLRDAITLLGMKMVRNLVFLQAKKSLNQTLKKEIFKRLLQELPILTALISLDMATPLKFKRQQAEQFFLSSLFRKIGMSVLALSFTQKYLEILDVFELGDRGLFDIEKEGFNVTSIDMGVKVFKTWNMPEAFINIIQNQNFRVEDIENVNDVDRITRIAETFALSMLGLEKKEGEDELLNILLKRYEAPEEMTEIFGEDYYEMIKDHPLYIMAVS